MTEIYCEPTPGIYYLCNFRNIAYNIYSGDNWFAALLRAEEKSVSSVEYSF
jgi:hypothetical protein